MDRLVTRNRFTATYTGKGEFYSGIRSGERVLLTVETIVYWYDRRDGVTPQKSSSHLSIQRLDGNSPHLSVRLNEIEDVRPCEIVDAAA